MQRSKANQAASITFILINEQLQAYKKLTFLNQEFGAVGTLKI